jgi:putative transposase
VSTICLSSLSDAEWECLQQHFPSKPSCGGPRTHSLREICNAIFYVLRTSCPWRYLPCNFPPWQTVYYHFRQWCLKGNWHQIYTALRAAERERVGKNAESSAAIIGAQSVKTVEESASISGYDAHKRQGALRGTSSLTRPSLAPTGTGMPHVKGRKRHILVDTLGCRSPSTSPLPMCMTPEELVAS